MKILTTQNLTNSTNFNSTNYAMSNKIRNTEHSGQSFSAERMYSNNKGVSFKGKKELIKSTEKVLQVIKEKISAAGKEKWYDKILTSSAFDSTLDLMSHEVFVQAAISFIVCAIFRPLTIMAMALGKEDKKDDIYASSHAISSALMGLASSFLIAIPFSKGIKYAKENAIQNLKEEILQKRFPHLNTDTIWENKALKVRNPIELWKDKAGNNFSQECKSVMMVARPVPIQTVSEETLRAKGVDVDLKEQAGKKFSEMVDRKGNKLQLDVNEMFVMIEEEGMGKNLFSLGLADKKFLAEVFENLDIATIEKNGKRINPIEWKNKDGSQFMPDIMDHIHLSSYRETFEAMPLYSGAKRTVTRGKEMGKEKYCSFQTNICNADATQVPDRLGTEITQEMLDRDFTNDVLYKLLGWMPDILTRPLVSSATIALLPKVLKYVFHLEKPKKPEAKPASQAGKAVA